MAQSPRDFTAWRLLGKLRQQAGELSAARDAFGRAVRLDGENAAAHCGYAEVLLELGQPREAAQHFRQTMELAPQSDYAQRAGAALAKLPASLRSSSGVVPAGYEIKQFDRSEVIEKIEENNKFLKTIGGNDPVLDDAPPLWSIQLETGGLFNTNLSLSPTNRNLAPESTDSFQVFVNPLLEYALFDDGQWRLGPVLAGYFTVNDGAFRDLNLESYQPGFFLERLFPFDDRVLVPRVQYDYTLDRFGGANFGQRHALTLSLAGYEDCGDVRLVYWSVDYTDFVDDGEVPSLASRDGWTNTLGYSDTTVFDLPFRSFRWGVELQRADTEGDDFRYNSVAVNAEVEVPLFAGLLLILDGGWGYRDYPDSDLSPSRNENVWHAGARCRKQFTGAWSASLVFNYDRFDSDNELFASDRTVAGVISTLEY